MLMGCKISGPRRTFRYRVWKLIKTAQVYLGLKSRKEAELELRLFVLEAEFEDALREAYEEIFGMLKAEAQQTSRSS